MKKILILSLQIIIFIYSYSIQEDLNDIKKISIKDNIIVLESENGYIEFDVEGKKCISQINKKHEILERNEGWSEEFSKYFSNELKNYNYGDYLDDYGNATDIKVDGKNRFLTFYYCPHYQDISNDIIDKNTKLVYRIPPSGLENPIYYNNLILFGGNGLNELDLNTKEIKKYLFFPTGKINNYIDCDDKIVFNYKDGLYRYSKLDNKISEIKIESQEMKKMYNRYILFDEKSIEKIFSNFVQYKDKIYIGVMFFPVIDPEKNALIEYEINTEKVRLIGIEEFIGLIKLRIVGEKIWMIGNYEIPEEGGPDYVGGLAYMNLSNSKISLVSKDEEQERFQEIFLKKNRFFIIKNGYEEDTYFTNYEIDLNKNEIIETQEMPKKEEIEVYMKKIEKNLPKEIIIENIQNNVLEIDKGKAVVLGKNNDKDYSHYFKESERIADIFYPEEKLENKRFGVVPTNKFKVFYYDSNKSSKPYKIEEVNDINIDENKRGYFKGIWVRNLEFEKDKVKTIQILSEAIGNSKLTIRIDGKIIKNRSNIFNYYFTKGKHLIEFEFESKGIEQTENSYVENRYELRIIIENYKKEYSFMEIKSEMAKLIDEKTKIYYVESDNEGKTKINVKKCEEPVILILASHKMVDWEIDNKSNVRIKAIIYSDINNTLRTDTRIKTFVYNNLPNVEYVPYQCIGNKGGINEVNELVESIFRREINGYSGCGQKKEYEVPEVIIDSKEN